MISIVTPVMIFKNKDRTLSRTVDRLSIHIKSLKYQQKHLKTIKQKVEIIIVNHSKDKDIDKQILKICNKYGVKYIEVKSNLIFNKALLCNVGIRQSSGEYVAIAEMDMIFRKDLLIRMYRDSKRNNSISLTHNFYINENSNCNYGITNNAFGKYRDFGFFKENKPGRAEGGIQLYKRDHILKLNGLSTSINLIGGYDNEILKRARLIGIKTTNHHPNSNGIFSVHIPHKKSIFPDIDSDYISANRQVNKFIYSKINKIENKNFIFEEEQVVGFRNISNNLVYGARHCGYMDIKEVFKNLNEFFIYFFNMEYV